MSCILDVLRNERIARELTRGRSGKRIQRVRGESANPKKEARRWEHGDFAILSFSFVVTL